jgi:hypothetical protein
MATFRELKEREVGLLNSHNSRFKEYGIACRDILRMCLSNALPRLSENVLITEMAEQYAAQEKHYYNLTKNEKHRLHIKIASEYYFKEFLAFDELHKILDQEDRILTFEEARMILAKDQETFNRIQPRTLIDVLEFIKLTKRDPNENQIYSDNTGDTGT